MGHLDFGRGTGWRRLLGMNREVTRRRDPPTQNSHLQTEPENLPKD